MWTSVLVLAVCSPLAPAVLADGAPWWKDAVFYRLLVDSFKDSDGDGLGDIAGATKQLSYVRALGANAILLSPLAAKSKDCAKPGVLDPSNLDIRYGTLANLAGLQDKAKKLDLKLVLELELQTSSVSSEWFGASANRSAGFDDWFIWQDGAPDQPPEPIPGLDTWSWNEERNSYWRSRGGQAVLNLCSEGLRSALSAVQCAWLRRGLAGVLISPDFPADQTCSEQLVRQLSASAVHCARSASLEAPLVLVESSLDTKDAARYYGEGGVGATSVLSNVLSSTDRKTTSETAVRIYEDITYAPYELQNTWVTSSVADGRISSRYGSDMVDAVNLLTLALPGAAVIQQGDELGVADTLLEWATPAAGDSCWPSPMRPAAAPFPWDDTMGGGFSSSEPWLPLTTNYRYANAKAEFASESSHAAVVRIAAAMRKSPAIGPHVEITRLGDALSVLRWGGTGSLLVVCNLSKDPTEVQLARVPGLAHEMTVAASSAGSSLAVGAHVALEKTMRLTPGEAVLMAGAPRHCGGPGPVDKIASKLNEGWQRINKYFGAN